MDTGRTSASKPNLQNPPRKGGVRECFVSRPGTCFVFTDYDTLELRALSQACLDILGRSKMAEALRRGEDLHLSLAAEMLGISVADALARQDSGDPQIAEYRQQAKPANFGFPGGMAAPSFREYAEGYGVKLSEAQAQDIRDAWFKKWPEMQDYFSHVGNLRDPLTQLRSGRLRGGASFTAAANGFFQGLAADGAKEALWRVAKECYTDPESPLWGCHPVLFLHDEIGLEVPDGNTAAAERLAVVMREAMQAWIPDVPITCGPVMMRRWYKGAKAVRENGVLVPCKPEGKKWTLDR
jgi:DNA polymerase I-like protein with 3'-5' exonuclease and polymerase domains